MISKATIIILAMLLMSVHSRKCPKECECNGDNTYSKCTLNNGTIILELDARNGSLFSTLIITCEDENISHVELPRVDAQPIYVHLYSCSPSILREVPAILDEPLIKGVKLYNISQPLKSEDIANFENAIKLNLELVGDSLIPITAISSWSPLTYLSVTGGMLQISSTEFNKSKSLTNLKLINSKLRAAPGGDFHWLPNLKRLVLINNTLEEIRVGAFRGLNNLDNLWIENPIKIIDYEAFADVPKLRHLTLRNVLVETVPNELPQRIQLLENLDIECAHTMKQIKIDLGTDVFSKPTLRRVHMKSCEINNITENLFSDSNGILYLLISNNIINHISSNLFLNQTKMWKLDLSNNSLSYLPAGIFDTLYSLKYLYLNDNKLLELPVGIFNNLASLNKLRLGNNGLQHLQETIFSHLTSLNLLSLEGNNLHRLSENIFTNLLSLEILNLAGNGILKLPLFDYLQLTSLNLAFNKVIELGVIHLDKLISLDLRGNRIKYLALCTFCGLRNLTELNLSNNTITTIVTVFKKSVFINSPFAELPKLETLDLSRNNLRDFFFGWTSELQQTRVLNLSSNRLDDIKVFQVDYSNLNITVDLRYNNISKIELNPTVSNPSSKSPATSQLLLDDNPLNCDCRALGLLLRLQGARLHHEPQYIFNNSTCYTPPKLKGNLLERISPKDLICDLSKYSPNNCSSVNVNAGTNEVTLHCSTIPSSLPDPKSNYFPPFYDEAEITLNLNEQPKSINHLNINKLNLSNAKIHRITFKPTASLKVIDLSHNYLATIPENFVNENITLYLSSNLLNCDCNLVSSLIKSKSLADASDVFCVNEGKNITDIDVSELCFRTMAITSFIGTTAVCGVFLTMITVAYCKYAIKNRHSIINSVCRRTSENAVESVVTFAVKPFDLYISFVDEDEEFIRESLIVKLEHEFNQNVCLHYRDWTVNDPIPEQIIQSVNNSKRTVIILTEDYLLSEWSDFTFKKARSLEIQEGMPKIIIVLLNKDVLNNDRLNDDFKSYIVARSYLYWEDPNFWRIFRDILPNKYSNLFY